MGGDGDALEVRWHRELTPEWHLTLGGFAWRKGEGKVDDWFGSAKEREENAFLSGVVETTRGIVVGVDGFLGDVSLSGDVRAGVVGNNTIRKV